MVVDREAAVEKILDLLGSKSINGNNTILKNYNRPSRKQKQRWFIVES